MTRSMEGIINFWNHSAEKLYGWREEEAVGKVSHDLLKTQFPKPLEEIESELVRNGQWEGKLVHTTREGTRVVVESRWTLDLEGQIGGLIEINARANNSGRRANGTRSESKKPENLRRRTVTTLQPLEHIFELVNDSIMTRSMEGRINFWNYSAEELYGWRKEEAVGKVSHDLLKTQFPKPLEEIESELVRNGRWEGKLVHTTRDGGLVVVESRWSLEQAGQLRALVEINRRAADPDACTDTDSVERVTPEPTIRLLNAAALPSKIANVVLAAGAFLCILAASYGFTRLFSDSTGKLLYGFLPIGLACLLFASLRLKPSHKINLAIFFVSLAASVYGMELFLWKFLDSTPKIPLMLDLRRSSDKENDAAQLMKTFGVQIDTRNPNEVIADLNNSGVDTIPFFPHGNNLFVERDGYRASVIKVGGAEVIPLAGISNKSTLLCNENGQWVSYMSDAYGFNNPDTAIWKSASVSIALWVTRLRKATACRRRKVLWDSFGNTILRPSTSE